MILSRKILFSVLNNLDKIVSGQFTEETVKLLLIDLREPAKAMLPFPEMDPKHIEARRRFIEVCDFIAHPNKDRGDLEKEIRAHAEKMADAFQLGGERWQAVTANRKTIHGGEIVNGLQLVLSLYLHTHGRLRLEKVVDAFRTHLDDLSLCIISILQDSVIQLNDNRGQAILNLVTHDQYYWLYCQVFGSRAETDARARTGGTGRFVLGFPVIVTNAKDHDHVLAEAPDGVTVDDIAQPDIVETYRGVDGRLCLRLAEDPS